MNTIRLAIADVNDALLDSWVFLKAGSFECTPLVNAPICESSPGEALGVLGTGSAADNEPGDLGITQVTLEPDSVNAELVVDAPVPTPSVPQPVVSYTVNEIIPGQGGSATVLVTNGTGQTCSSSFMSVPAGPVTNQTLCLDDDLQFLASTVTTTSPAGTALCDVNDPEPSDPPLPEGIIPSPPIDPNPCRSITLDTPIETGTALDVTMVYKKEGPYDPLLRILLSEQVAGVFQPYEDVTKSVRQILDAQGNDPTRIESKKVKWSPVKVTCGILSGPLACEADPVPCSVGIGECTRTGFVECDIENPTPVCLGFAGPVVPGSPREEVCDAVDNDCDGEVDEDAFDAPFWYADMDNDTFGDPETLERSCDQPAGFVADGSDCNDADGTIHPGAMDICNGVDDNCNGIIDEDFDCLIPVCTGAPSTDPGVLATGTATDVGPGETGIFSVALEPGSQNASLVVTPTPPAGTVGFDVNEIITGLGGFGTVVATDGANRQCRLSFSVVPPRPGGRPGPLLRGWPTVSASSDTATEGGGATCVTAPIDEGELPPEIQPSPPGDPNECRVLILDTPINSPGTPDVTMVLKKDGPYDPNLRILLSEMGETGYGPFTDVTDAVTEIPNTNPDPTRIESKKVKWSPVRVTCGTLESGVDCDANPTTCSVGAGECARPGITGCDGAGERACLDDLGNVVSEGDPLPEVCDGLDNDCDGIVDNATLTVGAVDHQVGAGSHPGSIRTPIEGLLVSLYDKSEGSCVRDVCDQGVSWQCYESIFDVCATVVVNGGNGPG